MERRLERKVVVEISSQLSSAMRRFRRDLRSLLDVEKEEILSTARAERSRSVKEVEDEVETLKPWDNDGVTRARQSRDVNIQRFGDQRIFQCRSFLSDLQIAVTIGSLEAMMQFGHQIPSGRIGKADLLTQHQRASWPRSIANRSLQ